MPITRKKPTVPHLRGLPATRHGAVALAMLCAVVAAGILLVAIGQYKKSVQTSDKQDSVLVATGLIQKGTSGEVIGAEGLVRSTPILAKSVAYGAVSNTAALVGKVATQNILPGQQLTYQDFTTSLGIETELAPNQRAMAFSLDTEHGLTDVLTAGDRVDIYGEFGVANGSQSTVVARLLASDVLVLRAASSGAGSGGLSSGAGGAQPLLLAINDKDIETMALTLDKGQVWLALRPANASAPPNFFSTVETILDGVYARHGVVPVGTQLPPDLTVVGEVNP